MSEHDDDIVTDPCTRWSGAVTGADVTALRGQLFDALEAPGVSILWLDVRDVTDIDRAGVALLLGAQGRAAALDRQLILIDSGGVVTDTLNGLLLRGELDLVQLLPEQEGRDLGRHTDVRC
jgi:anti-anti-sigma regulatory factor